MEKYIRIGELPENNGPSRKWKDDEEIVYEKGVSVYECTVTPTGKYGIIMPYPFKQGIGMTYECLTVYSDRHVYLVEGRRLESRGSDNEPLLEPESIRILDDITYQFRKISYKDFVRSLEYRPKNWREGQKIINSLINFKYVYKIIMRIDSLYKTELDCFYGESRTPKTLEFLEKNWDRLMRIEGF